jgi:hypothetical protein
VASYLGQDATTINRSGGAERPVPEWLTTAEYAQRHDLSVGEVRRRVRTGALPSQRGARGYLVASPEKENA